MRNTRTIRADIPTDVWDRLAAEALRKGVPLGRHLRSLLVRRDERLHGASPSTDSGNKEEQ